MKQAFPELELKRGFVYTNRGVDQHWWLESSDGTVIDPTAFQFGTVFEYKDGMAVKIGSCMECGAAIYAYSAKEVEERTNRFCQKSCEQKYIAYINNI